MIKVDNVIIVEGRYDKIKLSSLIDGVIIETDGFGIFKNKEKQKMIRRLAKEKGLVILTDSDSAGFKIRSFIGSIVPQEYITNVYIPDIYGKEKRKIEPSKEGKLGVEGVSADVLINAFQQSGICCESSDKEKSDKAVSNLDFFEDGLTGGQNSSYRRKQLLKYLELPENMSSKGLIEIINICLSYDEYKIAVKKSMEVQL